MNIATPRSIVFQTNDPPTVHFPPYNRREPNLPCLSLDQARSSPVVQRKPLKGRALSLPVAINSFEREQEGKIDVIAGLLCVNIHTHLFCSIQLHSKLGNVVFPGIFEGQGAQRAVEGFDAVAPTRGHRFRRAGGERRGWGIHRVPWPSSGTQ